MNLVALCSTSIHLSSHTCLRQFRSLDNASYMGGNHYDAIIRQGAETPLPSLETKHIYEHRAQQSVPISRSKGRRKNRTGRKSKRKDRK